MGVTTMEPLLPPRPRPGPSLLLLCLFLLWSLAARLPLGLVEAGLLRLAAARPAPAG
ncbi:hypothetical protein [Nocardiopsis composta]|uniref:Uncharacterized protein n=1 Tax=Nocardiopsis composta TaxID=157465 RepID=A0A7W8QL01_9ACTN|nr:hypothetical protein [Nocardiopsis composta]MBB5432397.1 hypothetical protein [Nocardiopsis composta]